MSREIQCPKFKSANMAKFPYGLPAYSKELEKKLETGTVALRGCIIERDSPKYTCNGCGHEW
jgi:hypothetical protein